MAQQPDLRLNYCSTWLLGEGTPTLSEFRENYLAAEQDRTDHGKGTFDSHFAGIAGRIRRDGDARYVPRFSFERLRQAVRVPAAFGNKFADWCVQAGLQPVFCDDGRMRSYRAHGLRKAACKALAHAGCTAPEIMSVSGHSTLAQVQVYIDEFEAERMAESAIDKLTEQRTSSG